MSRELRALEGAIQRQRHITRRLRVLLLLCAACALIAPGTVQAQDVRTPVRVLDHDPAGVGRVHFSPDGTRLVTVTGTALADYDLYVWDLTNDSEPLIIPISYSSAYIAWNADSTYFLSRGFQAREVHVWSVEGGTPIEWPHTLYGFDPKWSPDGTRVLTHYGNAIVARSILDPDDAVVINPLQKDAGEGIRFAQWGVDGQVVFGSTGMWSEHHAVYIWHADGSGLVTTLEHDTSIDDMILSHDGNTLLTKAGHAIRIWTLDGSKEPVVLAHAEPPHISYFAWDGHTNRIMTTDWLNGLWAWTWDESGVTCTKIDHPGEPRAAVSPVLDGVFAVYASWMPEPYDLRILGLTPGDFEEPLIIPHPPTLIAIWNPVSDALLTWGPKDVMRVYPHLNGGRTDFVEMPHNLLLAYPPQWSPDGTKVVTWDRTRVFIWSPFEE